MRFGTMMTAVMAAGLLATGAQARTQDQSPAGDGQYRAALERMITRTAEGTCPDDVMGADLLAACQTQVEQMSEGLKSLGAIVSMRLIKVEGEGADRLETYAVAFASGETLTWGIGGLVDGKFATAYARS